MCVALVYGLFSVYVHMQSMWAVYHGTTESEPTVYGKNESAICIPTVRSNISICAFKYEWIYISVRSKVQETNVYALDSCAQTGHFPTNPKTEG